MIIQNRQLLQSTALAGLREALRFRQLTESELANRTGLSVIHLTQVLRGHGTLTVDMLSQIARAIGMEISFSMMPVNSM